MLFNIIPRNLIDRVNETELVIYFKNGSVYQLKGSDDPEALRGPNPFGVVFDEFDTQKQDGWGIVEPILRANGGWAWFIGTPRGKNKLYALYHKGREGHSEWKSWLLKASESGIIESNQLAEARKSPLMTEAMYKQEFECDFIEAAGSVFRGVREIMTAKPHDPNSPGHENEMYVIGVDLAKVQDYTVISVYSRSTNEQVYLKRIKTIEWPFQKKIIASVARNFHNALIMLDATGVGDPIADDLIRSGLSVEPFKITEQTKKDIIEKLAIWIEQKKIKLLPSEETLFEYDNFGYELGPTGKIRYGARQGFHDDIVLADALAIWSLQPIYAQSPVQIATPLQMYKQRVINNYEFNESNNASKDWTEWEDVTDEHGFQEMEY